MKVLKVEKITDCQHLNLFSLAYKSKSDLVKNWTFASRSNAPIASLTQAQPSPDAVVVVPFHTSQKKLVIIKEYRVVLGGYQYGFPAGLVDPGESVEEAGKRELFEETGLTMTKILKKSPAVFSSSGLTDESVSLLFVECDGVPSDEYNEDSEEIEVVFVSQEDAMEILEKNDEKFDVKSWIVLNTFAALGRI
ncbi:MAG: NUDIX hydrolase [Desulfobacteraceae bacterium]|nr:NUDIX hydrolase [Desulfobacteraceae bacterium]